MVIREILIREDGSAVLYAYLHEANQEMSNAQIRPAVLVMGGGGYYGCSSREADPVALAYVAQGYHAFRLNYSCYPIRNYPAPLEDAQAAMQIIYDHAEEWLIDVNRIAAAGFSAGGHLALALGTGDKNRPNALILGYPVVLDGTCNVMAYSVPSLDVMVDSQTPPTFLFSTCEDELVPIRNSFALGMALDKNSVPFEMHIFQRGKHGLGLARSFTSGGLKNMVQEDAAKWFELSMCWLIKLWGDFESEREELIPALTEYDTYSADVLLEDLWKNEKCKAIILSYFPDMTEENVQKTFEYHVSLNIYLFANGTNNVKAATIQEINEKLRAIPVVKR